MRKNAKSSLNICLYKKTALLSHFYNKCVTEMKDSAQNIAKQRSMLFVLMM